MCLQQNNNDFSKIESFVKKKQMKQKAKVICLLTKAGNKLSSKHILRKIMSGYYENDES